MIEEQKQTEEQNKQTNKQTNNQKNYLTLWLWCHFFTATSAFLSTCGCLICQSYKLVCDYVGILMQHFIGRAP